MCIRDSFEEAAALAAEGVTVDVTAFPPDDSDPALPAHTAVGRWLDRGLPTERLTVSSDGSGCLPHFDDRGELVRMDVGRPETLLSALAELRAEGRSLAQILPMFTSNAAKLLRLRGKGRLRVGADADLVLLDERTRPQFVIARGRFMVRDGAPCIRGAFELEGEREGTADVPGGA